MSVKAPRVIWNQAEVDRLLARGEYQPRFRQWWSRHDHRHPISIRDDETLTTQPRKYGNYGGDLVNLGLEAVGGGNIPAAGWMGQASSSK
ncbi:MAG: hypothetical protein FJX25_18010 [Alphaproteobacteria bacterium]|nr:hypothetical protein [Alphaproteobacteria bacterium]